MNDILKPSTLDSSDLHKPVSQEALAKQ